MVTNVEIGVIIIAVTLFVDMLYFVMLYICKPGNIFVIGISFVFIVFFTCLAIYNGVDLIINP